jgi:hypothetical protein
MTIRKALVVALPIAVLATAGCRTRRYAPEPMAEPVAFAPGSGSAIVLGSGSAGAPLPGPHPMADVGAKILEALPWHPAVHRIDLGATGPVALVQVYRLKEDILAVDATGRVFCLSARELTPKWVSSLKAPLSAPPAETPTHYLFLESDGGGAAWLQWFSKRAGAEADVSPVRLPYTPSSGISATITTAYVASLGSPRNNKTVESINLADGTLGWGFRTSGRVVATPTVDPGGDTLLVCCEDFTVTALPAAPAGETPSGPSWEAVTLGANVASPVIVKDWAYVVSEDNFVRCYDVHGGDVRWMKGTDAANRKAPWVLGGLVTKDVAVGGEGSGTVKVERFEGTVFVRNELGLHAFDADTGEAVFRDAGSDRPLVKVGSWVVTLDGRRRAQLRQGAGLPVKQTADLSAFDLLPTNQRDGSVVAAMTDGTVFLAVPK